MGIRKALQDKNITLKAYAEFLGITEKTLQNKLNGISPFTYPEASKTKKELLPEYDIEYLFGDKGE